MSDSDASRAGASWSCRGDGKQRVDWALWRLGQVLADIARNEADGWGEKARSPIATESTGAAPADLEGGGER